MKLLNEKRIPMELIFKIQVLLLPLNKTSDFMCSNINLLPEFKGSLQGKVHCIITCPNFFSDTSQQMGLSDRALRSLKGVPIKVPAETLFYGFYVIFASLDSFALQ